MFNFLAWIHTLLFRLCFWLLKQPFRGIWTLLVTLVALLGEEFRRWAGIAVSGLLIVLAGKATLAFAPAELKRPLVLTVLVLLAVWALAVMRAARYTSHTNLRAVRQRQYFWQLSGELSEVRQRMPEVMAKATQGTPVGMVFKPNRDAKTKAEADAQEAERQAEANRRAAEAEERRLEELAALEPDPYV